MSERTVLIRGPLTAALSATLEVVVQAMFEEKNFCRRIPTGLFEGILDGKEAPINFSILIVIPEWLSDFLIEWSKSQQAQKTEEDKVEFKLLDPLDRTAVALNLKERIVKVSGNGEKVAEAVISSFKTMVEYDSDKSPMGTLCYHFMTVKYSHYYSCFDSSQYTYQELTRQQQGFLAYQHLIPTDQPSHLVYTPFPTTTFPHSCSSPDKKKNSASRKTEAGTTPQQGQKDSAFPMEHQYEVPSSL